jgi:hypothetical protein
MIGRQQKLCSVARCFDNSHERPAFLSGVAKQKDQRPRRARQVVLYATRGKAVLQEFKIGVKDSGMVPFDRHYGHWADGNRLNSPADQLSKLPIDFAHPSTISKPYATEQRQHQFLML